MKRLWSFVTSSGSRDTLTLTAGNITDSIIAFLFTVISFRLLAESDFGLFSAFNNLIFSAAMILDFGLSQALLYYLPRQKGSSQNTTIGSAIFLRLLIASIFSFILIVSAPLLVSHFFPGSTFRMIHVVSLAIIFASFIDVLIFSFQGRRQFLLSVIVSNTYSFCRLLAVLVFANFTLPYTAISALSITVYGPILGILLGLYLLKPHKPTLNLSKQLLNFGGFMGIYRICQIVALRSDVQIVLTTLGASVAGTYSVAARMANFYPLIIITLNSLFSSRLRQSLEIPHKFIKKSILLTFLVLLAMLFCAWQAPFIIRLLFGEKAALAGLIYRFLTLAYLPLMTATLPISILVFHKSNTKFVGLLGIIQVIVMLTISFMFTNRLSQYGPILGLSIANSLVFILSCYKVFKLWK